MAGTIEKIITTKADFEAGIVKFIMTPEWKDNVISMKQDRTDDKLASAHLHATFAGTSTIVEGFVSSQIEFIRTALVANTAYINSDILPEQYEIKFQYSMAAYNAGGGGTPNVCIGGIGKYYAATNPLPKVYIMRESGILGANLFIVYVDTVGTKHYWYSGAWNLSIPAVLPYTDGTCKIIKDATNYTIIIYDTTGALVETAVIAIASVQDNQWQDHFISGDIDNAVVATYDFFIWNIYGIYIDRYAEKPGAFSAIVDLGSRPIIPGTYVETINSNWYDEENPQELANGRFSLKIDVNSTKLSQGFKTTKDGYCDKIRLNIYNGTCVAADKIWVEIWTDDGTGKPNALIACYVSNQIDMTNVMVGRFEYTYTEFIFSTPTTILLKNIQYHIVIQGTWAVGTYAYVQFETPGTYAKGKCNSYSSLSSTWTNEVYDLIFGIKLIETQLITRKIGYANSPDYKILSSKTDFEGNNEVQSQIDTATTPGTVKLAINAAPFYFASGYIQNDIDLGVVPAYYCTFSADYYIKQVDTTLVFKVATSDDNIAWTGFTTLTMTQGYCDLTALGKHRYWRIKIEYATTDAYYTPEVYSWTIDYFSPMTEFQLRDKIQAYRFIKLLYLFETYNPLTSIELTEIYLSFLIAYELYIKRVKYKISSSGITADMELSSQ